MTFARPFGDHLGDGIVQVCFSLPVSRSQAGRSAARRIAEQMGLMTPEIVHEIDLTSTTTYFILFGKVAFAAEAGALGKSEIDELVHSKEELEIIVSTKLSRPITVVGASTGTDTHSLGLDAILNHKGYHGHCGLEAYKGFEVRNLGSQVPNEKLIAEATRLRADAILVSQTVTQQDLHIENLTELVDLLEAEELRDRFVLICGGARISPGLAKELGFDAGFSKRTYAEHVASFLVNAVLDRTQKPSFAP